MGCLEDLKPGACVRGVLLSGLVTVVTMQWHGSEAVELTYKDAAGKVGNELFYRDAGRIAEEVIAHLSGLVGAKVTVTLEIEAAVSDGVPDNVVRTVTENGRTLNFTSHGFEKD